MLAAAVQAAEVSELNRKLQVADEKLDRINKRFEETQGMRKLHVRSDMYSESVNSLDCLVMITIGTAEVESLKGACPSPEGGGGEQGSR